MLVVDMGAEYHGYTADVTRTLPVDGVFSPEEKAKLEDLRNSPNFEPRPDASDKGFFERMKEFFN